MNQREMRLPADIDELKDMEVWCNYALVPLTEEQKKARPNHTHVKRPLATRTLKLSGWNELGATFDEAAASVGKSVVIDRQALKVEGVGLLPMGGYLALDLDGLVNEWGQPLPLAEKILEKLKTYTEYSSSGKGLHCLMWVDPEKIARYKGDENGKGKWITSEKKTFPDGTELQILTNSYCAMTFREYGTWELRGCTKELEEIAREYFGYKDPALEEPEAPQDLPAHEAPLTDREARWDEEVDRLTDPADLLEAIAWGAENLGYNPSLAESLRHWYHKGAMEDASAEATRFTKTLWGYLRRRPERVREIYEKSALGQENYQKHVVGRKDKHWMENAIAKGLEYSGTDNYTGNIPYTTEEKRDYARKMDLQRDLAEMERELNAEEAKQPENPKNETEKPKKEDKATGGMENTFQWRPWMEDNGLGDFDAYIDRNATGKGTPPWSTGFPGLDRILDGGFYEEELVVVGAVSSLGKTSFILQVAANVAEAGRPVLFFSLEMSRRQLYGKLISAFMFEASKQDINAISFSEKCGSLRDVLRGRMFQTKDGSKSYAGARARLGEVAKNLHVLEGCNNISVDDVKEAVEGFIAMGNPAPLVVLDYLQILQPSSQATVNGRIITDKRLLVGYDVTALKVLARDHKLPVVVISSFNRTNYLEPVNLASFKEAGEIEYSGDLVIGMQPQGMDYGTKIPKSGPNKGIERPETKGEHDTRVRSLMIEFNEMGKDGRALPIEIKVIKARSGVKDTCTCRFKPVFNYYDPRPIAQYNYCSDSRLTEEEEDKLARGAADDAITEEAALEDLPEDYDTLKGYDPEYDAKCAEEEAKKKARKKTGGGTPLLEDEAARAAATAPPVIPKRGQRKK